MDPEILESFREETNQILSELNVIIEKLESPLQQFPSAELADFSQKIDRVMGAAKTLGLDQPDHAGLKSISQLSEICKTLGYKASHSKNPALIPLFAAFWADTIETIKELLAVIEDEKVSREITVKFTPILQSRLKWLLEKLAN